MSEPLKRKSEDIRKIWISPRNEIIKNIEDKDTNMAKKKKGKKGKKGKGKKKGKKK